MPSCLVWIAFPFNSPPTQHTNAGRAGTNWRPALQAEAWKASVRVGKVSSGCAAENMVRHAKWLELKLQRVWRVQRDQRRSRRPMVVFKVVTCVTVCVLSAQAPRVRARVHGVAAQPYAEAAATFLALPLTSIFCGAVNPTTPQPA